MLERHKVLIRYLHLPHWESVASAVRITITRNVDVALWLQ